MALSEHKSLAKILEFIKENEQAEPAHLVLKAKQFPDLPMREIAEQVASRKKAREKLPEFYAHPNILFPPAISMEQCSSQATAQFKASLIEGTKMVDLSGGFGIDTYYLSQSFRECVYVEQQTHLCELATYNFKQLNSSIHVENKEASAFLERAKNDFDWMYIDPARRDQNQKKVSRWEDCSPDITNLLPKILEKAPRVLLKGAPMLDISQAILDLSHQVKKVHIVEWRGEVRELLFQLGKTEIENPEITAVILSDEGRATQQFTSDKLKELSTLIAFSLPGPYLYEPSPAVMKSGFFKSLAEAYQLKKLHSNTNLFTSSELNKDFPGRSFRILESLPVNKKALKKLLPEMKANLSSRNFPLAVADLKKKLGLKDGGSIYLFACTLQDNSKRLLVCEKVNQD
ncbi:hypothetical protein JKA74_10775 [Marivirga sp. S37H4]|uniref:THUMP-like domain-containing protein n=1 Tax=Marivirga aurantiaca TaxID=2802615 RepID=A0A934WZ13_9BACT|nr:hypothetical protein [Marivirga aurantiaca]MBK6265521.1 hypothetical protein [Marivirga aurantiaca]